jgi:HK97 gp10 family phage protein
MADGNVRNAQRLNEKLKAIADQTEAVEKAMKKEIRRVRNTAVMLTPVNHGELRQSIMTSVERTDGGITATCYTNKSYAAYVEFGTGPKGQDSHQGISPNVQPTYTQEGWWFPGDNITRYAAKKYHWPKSTVHGSYGTTNENGGLDITTTKKILYYTKGQAAQPFMYPALKNNEDVIRANLAEAVRKSIREAAE